MAHALLVVFSNPTQGADEEFNRWYTEVHVPDIIKLGGASCGRRYRSSGVPLMPGVPEPGGYAAVYEVDADSVEQIEKIAAHLQESLLAGQVDISPSMDLTAGQAAWLLPITDPIRACTGD